MKAKTVERLREDLIDLKLAEQAMKEIERGECVTQTKEEFLKEMEQWIKK